MWGQPPRLSCRAKPGFAASSRIDSDAPRLGGAALLAALRLVKPANKRPTRLPVPAASAKIGLTSWRTFCNFCYNRTNRIYWHHGLIDHAPSNPFDNTANLRGELICGPRLPTSGVPPELSIEGV